MGSQRTDAFNDFLSGFHQSDGATCSVSADQGSRFAKAIAGDHNPLHDADAPRFCVPGDLLFALIIGHYGLAREIELTFKGMLRAEAPLSFPENPGPAFSICGEGDREYVSVTMQDALETTPAGRLALVRAYVACSGQTFPDLLDPLLEAHGVMFNPDRPFVVYDSMQIQLLQPPQPDVSLQLEDSALKVEGKRGDARFDFVILQAGERIGHCTKQMVVSGLRDYDRDRMAELIARYQQRRSA